MLMTSYHTTSIDHEERRKAVAWTIECLKDFPQDVGIVFTGISGILVGSFVADATNRHFAILRKPNEKCHGIPVEGYKFNKYVIVDDFIDSGDTINRIIKEYKSFTGSVTVQCVGIILYSDIEKRHLKSDFVTPEGDVIKTYERIYN